MVLGERPVHVQLYLGDDRHPRPVCILLGSHNAVIEQHFLTYHLLPAVWL